MSTTLDEMRSQSGPAPERTPLTRRATADQVAPERHMPNIRIGFGNMQSWEFTQRVARGFAFSSLVPEAYRATVPAGKFGKAKTTMVENPNAIPNCIIALNMADRLGADPLMVMQNLHIIEGRPAWSAQFVIASINSCGRYTTLQYDMTDNGMQTVDYEVEVWDDQANAKVAVKKRATVPNLTCVAWCTDKATGARMESAKVSMELAVLEGWYDRKGSKWRTPLRDQMLRYRAAAFLGRTYCPDLLMGLRTVDEETDVLEAERDGDGNWSVPAETVDEPAATEKAQTAQIAHEQTIPVDLGLNKAAASPELVERQEAASSEPSAAQKALKEKLESSKRTPAKSAPPEGAAPDTSAAQANKAPEQTGLDLGSTPAPKQPEADEDEFSTGE